MQGSLPRVRPDVVLGAAPELRLKAGALLAVAVAAGSAAGAEPPKLKPLKAPAGFAAAAGALAGVLAAALKLYDNPAGPEDAAVAARKDHTFLKCANRLQPAGVSAQASASQSNANEID